MELIDLSYLKSQRLKGVLRRFPEYYEYCFIDKYEDKFNNFHVHSIEMEFGISVSLLETKSKTIMVSIQLPIHYDRDYIVEFLDRYNCSFNLADEKGFYINSAEELVEGILYKGMPIVLYIRGKQKIYYDHTRFKEVTGYYKSFNKITNTGLAKEIEFSPNNKKINLIVNGVKSNNIPRINFDLSKDLIISNGQFIVADNIDEYCGSIGFYAQLNPNIPIAYFLDHESTISIYLDEQKDGSKVCIVEQNYNQDNIRKICYPKVVETSELTDRETSTTNTDNVYPLVRQCFNNKSESYRQLVEERKLCKKCEGITNPSGTNFDTNEIGAWSNWKNDLDARIVVVGQDWGDLNYFIKNEGNDDPNNPTNNKLVKLLESIGISTKEDKLFFTNAVLCLKEGGLSAKTKDKWFSNCGKLFLKPLLEIIRPEIVITLGLKAYKAVARVYNKEVESFDMIVNQKDPILIGENNMKFFPVYHCGNIGLLNRNFENQLEDWSRIRKYL